jgi:hypothetical protein
VNGMLRRPSPLPVAGQPNEGLAPVRQLHVAGAA